MPAYATGKTIYAFQGDSDAAYPAYGGLISDDAGNAYGTTAGGGGNACSYGGCGTVFKLTKDRKESVLYAFKGGSDGESPQAGLTLDASGNLYGTTAFGGAVCSSCGTVFRIASDGTHTVLYSFQDGTDGYYPVSNIVIDQSGNLFGTTTSGGGTQECGQGCGIVFEVQPNGTEIVLYRFQGGKYGAFPSGTLVADSAGNLYGTTGGGGQCFGQSGCGTVFKVTPSGQESILYDFQGGTDGIGPEGGVIIDNTGNLYGTTAWSGTVNNTCCGVVFEVSTGSGAESVLYNFRGGTDGANPMAGVVRDSKGRLFGTTEVGGEGGGGDGCKKVIAGDGCGTVFKLEPGGKETVLFAFHGRYGKRPLAPVLLGKNGAIYGVTSEGGPDKQGVVFEVTQ
jgi:uncharacterized repeat protein (TIGR03803 family)